MVVEVRSLQLVVVFLRYLSKEKAKACESCVQVSLMRRQGLVVILVGSVVKELEEFFSLEFGVDVGLTSFILNEISEINVSLEVLRR